MFGNKRYLLSLVTSALFLVASTALAGCGSSTAPTKSADQAGAEQIILATTIGPVDAGIVDAMEEAFQQKTGIVVRHIRAGTGEALKIAQQGTVDLVLVHAKALEEKFVSEGYGTQRYDLMYNDFLIMGPAADPAGLKGEKSAVAALKKLAAAEAPFVSRGDKSGTNVKELELWSKAGIEPQGEWYRIYEKGAEGNAQTLQYTDEQQAYTIIDRATYLTMKNTLKLEVLVEKDPDLLNFITLIPVNPEKFAGVNYDAAKRFVDWATSSEGQRLIKDFGKEKYGGPLFFPNSPAGKELK